MPRPPRRNTRHPPRPHGRVRRQELGDARSLFCRGGRVAGWGQVRRGEGGRVLVVCVLCGCVGRGVVPKGELGWDRARYAVVSSRYTASSLAFPTPPRMAFCPLLCASHEFFRLMMRGGERTRSGVDDTIGPCLAITPTPPACCALSAPREFFRLMTRERGVQRGAKREKSVRTAVVSRNSQAEHVRHVNGKRWSAQPGYFSTPPRAAPCTLGA